MKYLSLLMLIVLLCISCTSKPPKYSGNPIFEGWYADPEVLVFDDTYWVFPTYSAKFEDQTFFDAFSSNDLVHWQKHSSIIDTTTIKWAKEAMWAPSVLEHKGQYYFFFSCNDVQSPVSPWWNPDKDVEGEIGGIGIALADNPAGPYEDYLGKPLLNDFDNKAQPIDQFVYKDDDGQIYMFYGGWGHCNLGRLNDNLDGFIPWENGERFKEITPENYVEGPVLFKRNDIYYFMWSEGQWADDTYKVAYAMSDSITGPFNRIDTILESDTSIATGAGHNSVLNIPNTDDWFMVYHRRPIPNLDRDHRVTCIDKIQFDKDGKILPIKMTKKGVKEILIK